MKKDYKKLVLSRQGMGRIYRHFMGKKFAIIAPTQPRSYCPVTKFTNVNFPEKDINPEEKVRVSEIKNILKRNSLGYIQLKGWWKDDKHPGKFTLDNSFFIPNPPDRKMIDDLAKYFNQEGYIYGDGKNIVLWEQIGKKPCADYHKIMNFEKFEEGEGNVGFSELKKRKGKKFYFANSEEKLTAILGTAKNMWFPSKKVEVGRSILVLNYSFGKYTDCPVYIYAVDKVIAQEAKSPEFGKNYTWWAVI